MYDNYSRPINASRIACTDWVYDESVYKHTFTKQVMLLRSCICTDCFYNAVIFPKGHVLLRRVFSLIQKSDQNYWIFGCFYCYTTQFAITDTALNNSMTNNIKRRWRRHEN